MAGIGFELRRIYKRKTLAANIWGTLYATLSTIGPAVMSAVLILVLKTLLDQAGLTELESRFFISANTVAFVVATLVSVAFAAPVSRYISDCIFLNQEDNICPSAFGVLAISAAVSGAIMLIPCCSMWRQGGTPMSFLVCYYLLGVLVTCSYSLMTYASALKHYKSLTYSFLGGAGAAVLVFLAAVYWMGMHRVQAAVLCLVVDYAIIVFALAYQCVRAFGAPKGDCFEFLTYFRKYPTLAVAGFSYTLGLYAPTLIYWFFSGIAEQVSVFRTTPSFDVSMFLAVIVNMPSLVIFVVKVETTFYEKYTGYVSALNNGTYRQIERERGIMGRALRSQLFYVYEVQLILTIVLDCVVTVLFPFYNLSLFMLDMVVVLSLGVYAAFCMYFTIVVFYYFSDYGGAFWSALVFLGVGVAGAFVAVHFNDYYGLPLLVAGVCGWLVSFVLLRRRMENLDSFLMC